MNLPDDQDAVVTLPGQVAVRRGEPLPLRINCKEPMLFDSGGNNLYFRN